MKVSIIGLGYVGSVTAMGLAAAGHTVLGLDVDHRKVEAFRCGDVPIYEPELAERIGLVVAEGRLRFVHRDDVAEPLGDVIVVATGTPPGGGGETDLGPVEAAVTWIRDRQPQQGLVLMKSTVPPGTGHRLLTSMLTGSGLQYVANPEFLREGQAVHDWFHPDRIVIGGESPEAMATAQALYQGMQAPIVLTGITSAEMIKYAANSFLAMKISFINEIANLCDLLGADVEAVVNGIGLDPRIGSAFLRAGVGYGGSCFPKDVQAMEHLARGHGHDFSLLRAVMDVNNRQRLLPLRALQQCFGDLRGVRVAVLGLAFKPHTDDLREAPALYLIRALVEAGAVVRAYDPKAPARTALPAGVELAGDPVECAAGAQALVLMTEWPEIIGADWRAMAPATHEPRFLFDGRNALDPQQMRALGFEYRGVGRGTAGAGGA